MLMLLWCHRWQWVWPNSGEMTRLALWILMCPSFSLFGVGEEKKTPSFSSPIKKTFCFLNLPSEANKKEQQTQRLTPITITTMSRTTTSTRRKNNSFVSLTVLLSLLFLFLLTNHIVVAEQQQQQPLRTEPSPSSWRTRFSGRWKQFSKQMKAKFSPKSKTEQLPAESDKLPAGGSEDNGTLPPPPFSFEQLGQLLTYTSIGVLTVSHTKVCA